MTGNQVTGGNIGIDVIAFDGNTADARATLTNNTVNNAGTGIEAIDQSGATRRTGPEPGRRQHDQRRDERPAHRRGRRLLTGDTVGNTSFAGQSGYYIILAHGADGGHEVNATGATFGIVLASGATDAEQFAIVDKIVDAVDAPGVGLVRTRAGTVFVTANSFYAPSGTTAASVQRGVNAALAGETVLVNNGAYAGNVSIGKALTLIAEHGRAATTLNGAANGDLGTVVLTPGTNNVTIGQPGKGFTINGIDNGNPASRTPRSTCRGRTAASR